MCVVSAPDVELFVCLSNPSLVPIDLENDVVVHDSVIKNVTLPIGYHLAERPLVTDAERKRSTPSV